MPLIRDYMQGQKKEQNNGLRLAFMLSLTLGLAPFFPEPHLWGKIKWLWGGGVGMQAMDYFDVVLHGTPWLFLIVMLIITINKRLKSKEERK